MFDKVRKRNIPIVMLTSGGYLRETSKIIADSILNLKEKQLIGCTEAENAPPPKAGLLNRYQELQVTNVYKTVHSV